MESHLYPGITDTTRCRGRATRGSGEKRQREPKSSPSFERFCRQHAHDLPPSTPEEEHFRHSHWKAQRQRIRDALVSVFTSRPTLDRWDSCGSQCTVEWSASQKKYRLRANYCHSRHCEPCMRAKANTIAANLKKRITAEAADAATTRTKPHRFITLTLKHADTPLADQVKHLKASFKALRKSPLWINTQDGGAAIVEVKHTGTHWHPHLHIIATGNYIDVHELSAAWKKATGGSFIVDVRQLKDAKDAAHYVSKYVTKGTSSSVWQNPSLAQEWICATKGIRCCDTFGSWRGFKLLEHTTDVTDWTPVASLQKVIEAARQEEPWALAIMMNLRPPGTTDELQSTPRPPPAK